MKKTSLEFENIIGRYFNLKVKKHNYRIYVEEAGKGTPLLCLHTAGSDGRQSQVCSFQVPANLANISQFICCSAALCKSCVPIVVNFWGLYFL